MHYHSQQPGTGAPVHAGTCRLSPPVCRQYAYEREASEIHARWAWYGQTFWSPSSRELWRSVQPGASSADRHSHHTEDCYSSLDGCLWTREQASLSSQWKKVCPCILFRIYIRNTCIDLECSFLVHRYIFRISILRIKVTGSRPRSQEQKACLQVR